MGVKSKSFPQKIGTEEEKGGARLAVSVFSCFSPPMLAFSEKVCYNERKIKGRKRYDT